MHSNLARFPYIFLYIYEIIDFFFFFFFKVANKATCASPERASIRASFFKRPNIIPPKSSSKRASKKEMLKSFGLAITLWGRKLKRFKSIHVIGKSEFVGPRRENVPSYLRNKMFQPMLDHQTP